MSFGYKELTFNNAREKQMSNNIIGKQNSLLRGKLFGSKIYRAIVSTYHQSKDTLEPIMELVFCIAVAAGVIYYSFPLVFGDSALLSHNEVVARTSEIPDGSGKLRRSVTQSGAGADCIITVQYYEAKKSIFFHEYPVFQNEPDRIETIPCLSPK